MDEIRTIPRFHLLASRRFMLDNEIVLSEFVPGTLDEAPENVPLSRLPRYERL